MTHNIKININPAPKSKSPPPNAATVTSVDPLRGSTDGVGLLLVSSVIGVAPDGPTVYVPLFKLVQFMTSSLVAPDMILLSDFDPCVHSKVTVEVPLDNELNVTLAIVPLPLL